MLISIIIPVYNGEKFLRTAVDSVLVQTHSDLEIILVNDGSTDGTAMICDEYVLHDKRVKVIHKKNSGVSSARNAGLKIAQGEYIGFVDADDYVDVKMYEEMLVAAIDNDGDIVICGRTFHYGEKSQFEFRMPINDTLKIASADIFKNYLKRFRRWSTLFANCTNTLFRADLLRDKIYFQEDLMRSEDGWFIIDSLLASKRDVVILNKQFYHYRLINKNALMNSVKSNRVKLMQHLENAMILKLPGHKKQIRKMIYVQMCVGQIFEDHNTLIRGRKPQKKLKFKRLITILLEHDSIEVMFSAITMYFFSSIYVPVFNIYNRAKRLL